MPGGKHMIDGTKTTLKNGKVEYSLNGVKIRTSNNDGYKYCALYMYEGKWSKYTMKFSTKLEEITKFIAYKTRGYGMPFEGSHLWSDQFHDPSKFEIVRF